MEIFGASRDIKIKEVVMKHLEFVGRGYDKVT